MVIKRYMIGMGFERAFLITLDWSAAVYNIWETGTDVQYRYVHMQYLLQTVKHDCNVAKLGAGDIMLGDAEHGVRKTVCVGEGRCGMTRMGERMELCRSVLVLGVSE